MKGNIMVKNRKVYTPEPQKTMVQSFQTNEAIQRGEYEAKIDHFEYRINDLDIKIDTITNTLNSNIDNRIELDYLKRERLTKTNKADLWLKISSIVISFISVGISIYVALMK